MATTEIFPELEKLLDLAQHDGIDTRPTLLRVVTDLFVDRRIQSAEATRDYTRLTLRLLASANRDGRKRVAGKLSQDPLAPRDVILALARDDIAVAEPVLRHSPVLTTDDLIAIAADRGNAHAAAIAARNDSQAASSSGKAAPFPAGAHEDLVEAFFTSDADERRLILINLDLTSDHASAEPQAKPDVIDRLEAAALAHNVAGFARELERALQLTFVQARRIVDDAGGEAIVVAAKALQMPPMTLHRILMFIRPEVGQSVDRVYTLASLYEDISVQAALTMAGLWRTATPRPALRAHQPALWEDNRGMGSRDVPQPVSAPRPAVSFPRRTAS